MMIRICLSLLLAVVVHAENEVPGGDPASRNVSLRQSPGDLLGGTHRAICYSGFRSGQHPDRGEGAVNPSDEQILEDLKILSGHGGFNLIRLYDAKVNSAAVLRLIEAHDLDIKVLLGAWLDAEMSSPNCRWQPEPLPDELLASNKVQNRREVARAIALARKHPETVIAVAVGNETLVDWNDHMVPVDSVVAYVRQVKKAIKQPVTVADNYAWWAEHGEDLAKELDFVSVHIYPIWEWKKIEEALSYSIANMQAVRTALPESKLVITEAGWTTKASEFGRRADQETQKRYYHELFDWAEKNNITTFFFAAFDEDWKGDPNNPDGAEKHWGIYTIDRKPKLVMEK